MKRPSFQFYPADWRNNANLRRCSPAARGIWMDVLCVLHDSDQYGVVKWPLADLAGAANAPLKLVRELVEKRVLKGCDKGECEAFVYTPRSGRKDGAPVTLIDAQAGPIWYSSRFVRDEYVRTIRGESSRFGDQKDATPKAAPKPPIGDGPTTTSSSSPTVSSEPNGSGGKPPAEMGKEELWKAGKSLLAQDGLPAAQCGSFVGALVKQYGEVIVIDAVRSTVVHGAAGAREYLKATCMRMKGERGATTSSVPYPGVAQTAALLAERERHDAESVKDPAVVSAMVAGIKAKLTSSKEAV